MKKKIKTKQDIKPDFSGIEASFAELDKKFGKGTLMSLVQEEIVKVPVISTGSLLLDKALGAGGLPRGRIVEIYGTESSGKTTLCLSTAVNAQKMGGSAAIIDAEHAFDRLYAQKLGIDFSKLYISQPDNGEQALEIAGTLIRNNAVDVLIIDSVAALTPKAEIDGDFGDSVTFDTPVYIRNKINKFIDIVPISDLFCGDINKTTACNKTWYRKHKSIEILTHKGWQNINGVVRKHNVINKEIVCTRTSTGYVKTTKDHSLFCNGKAISPNELEIFDRIDIFKEVPLINEKAFINESLAWLIGFWVAEGSSLRTRNCNRFEVCNTNKKLIEQCADIIKKYCITSVQIRKRYNTTRKPLHILSCSASNELGYLMRAATCKNSKLKKIPIEILNANTEIKKAFLSGFFEGDGSHSKKTKDKTYYNNSLPIIAGIQYLSNCLGIRTNITVFASKPEQIGLRENTGKITRKENEILQFYSYHYQKYLWDISTEVGTFVSAIGNIILHNSHMGLAARMMSQALRKLTADISKSKTCVIFINQMRSKIGIVFGNPLTTTGGNALKYYSSIRIELSKREQLKKGDIIIGSAIKAKVTKNKIAAPFKTAEFELYFDSGISMEADILALAVEKNIINKSGAWYSYKEAKIGQGSEQVRQYLKDNPEACNEIKGQL